MALLKQVADAVRLFLASIQMAAHGRHHLVAIARTALAEGVGFDIPVEPFIRIELGTVARQLNQAKIRRVIRPELFRDPRPMHRMTIDNEIDFARTLPPQTLHEIDASGSMTPR